jgi:hypothetical protein
MLRRISFPTSLTGRKLLSLLILTLMGITVLAYDSSVNVEARWRVLPYQTLDLIGSAGDPSLVSVVLPAATDSDRARGYIESESAVRFHVASNIAWKLQLRLAEAATGLEVRRAGADFVDLATAPVVLAEGPFGVYDINLDVRRSVPRGAGAQTTSVQFIATIMPE